MPDHRAPARRLGPNAVFGLQSSAGNAATARLLAVQRISDTEAPAVGQHLWPLVRTGYTNQAALVVRGGQSVQAIAELHDSAGNFVDSAAGYFRGGGPHAEVEALDLLARRTQLPAGLVSVDVTVPP